MSRHRAGGSFLAFDRGAFDVRARGAHQVAHIRGGQTPGDPSAEPPIRAAGVPGCETKPAKRDTITSPELVAPPAVRSEVPDFQARFDRFEFRRYNEPRSDGASRSVGDI